MTPLAILTAWSLTASVEVTDSHGWHFKAIANDGAAAIADGCLKDPLIKGDDGRRCGSLLLVVGARESNYTLAALGDSGHACGPFQTHYPQPYTCDDVRSSWPKAVEIAIKQIRESMKKCPDFPLAPYARGWCGSVEGRVISTERINEAKRVFSIVPYPVPTW